MYGAFNSNDYTALMDLIKIRYPESQAVTYAGKLINFSDKPSHSGFLITDFTTERLYRFAVTEQYDEQKEYPLHFSGEEPVVYSKEEYIYRASGFLDDLKRKKFLKAIFSRIKKVDFDSSKIHQLFEQLCEEYPDAFVYLLSSEKLGTWVGASPEYVLEKMGKELYTMSLAGTKKDESVAWTEKEILEQEYVTKFIENSLKNINVNNLKSIGPYDFHAGPVIHLKTDIYAETDLSSLELALFLHPTPAVSGLPKMESIDLIAEHETHSRSIYAGIIGFYAEQNSSLYVNLRCAQIRENAAYLYLGGGFTKDSDVEKEWEETENKSRTLMNIMAKL